MNQVNLIGRITKDLETRQVGADKTVLSFSVAYNERWGDNEHVNFFDITAWGRQAETIAQYFKKGQRIGITGKLKQERYEAKDGSGPRSRVSITLREFEFIEPKGSSPSSENSRNDNHSPEPSPQSDFSANMDDDEVPF